MRGIKRTWTESQKDSIIEDYTKKGLTYKEIGRKYSASPDTISKYLHQWGIPSKKNRTKNRKLIDDYFEKIDTPEKAYFLGLLLADGAVTKDKDRADQISLELQEEDIEILRTFKKQISSDVEVRKSERPGRKITCKFAVRSDKMSEDLEKFNIIPNKTYLVDDLIPPANFIVDFIRGFVDGDGSIYYSKDKWHLSLTGHSQKMLQDFQKIINKMIGKEKSQKLTFFNNVYKVTWNNEDAIKIAKILYVDNNNIALARKRERAISAQEDKRRVEDIV